MKKKVFILAILILSFVFSSAEITLTEPLEVYNLGDKIYVSADGLIGADSGNLNIELNCGTNMSTNLVRIPARAFSAEEEQSYSLPYKILDTKDLEIKNLSQMVGSCQITASLGDLFSATKFFTISNSITVNSKLDKIAYDPGEPIKLTVEALKANGQVLNGFVQTSNATDILKTIENGVMEETFSMSQTSEPGQYILDILAYDSNSDGILNEGKTQISFIINQVASYIVLSLSEETIIPGEKLKVGAEIFDQSGKKMDGAIKIKLISPESLETEREVKSGENTEFEFLTNSTAGIWKMYAIFEDIIEEREITITEIQKAEFEIIDSVLEVRNVGNVLYNKTIEVSIGENIRELELKIKVGEKRKFNLKAPQGEYEVIVRDGDSSVTKQVVLTGNAISIKDLENVGVFKGYSIVWVFLVLVLLLGVILFYRKSKRNNFNEKNSSFALGVKKVGEAVRNKVEKSVPSNVRSSMSESMNFTSKSPIAQSLDSSNHSHEDKSMVDLTKKGDVHSAESSFVMNGEKYPSAIICVSVKNYGSLNENSKKELSRIMDLAREMKGLVDWKIDHAFIVFSPIITRTYNNESLAVRSASKILDELKKHNKKYNNKIEFNLGIHCGELIASKSNGKLKYTSTGNIISFAKRISDSDSEKLIVSDEVRRKLLRELKINKIKQIGDKQIYEIGDLKNKEANEAKLKDILNRMEEKKE